MAAHLLLVSFVAASCVLAAFLVYQIVVAPRSNPLRQIAGPPVPWWFGNHLFAVLEPSVSPKVHEAFVQRYGRSIRIRGVGPWDERLLTLDPVSVAYVLKHYTIYEKPWQSRRLITRLIGCGLLAAEGQIHKRQRRVATPAFSIQNMRALVPLVFEKGNELMNRWSDIIVEAQGGDVKTVTGGVRIDVCHWINRATFDVIGLAGFDYNFHAIRDETNELFCAYREMFEVAISQGRFFRTMLDIYLPYLSAHFPDKTMRTIQRCQEVIRRVAGRLVADKKRKIMEEERSNLAFAERDLLSLLLKSNLATDLPPECRISDEDILHNINTFMFAGSDTSSLSLSWTLLLLAQNSAVQKRLHAELLSVAPTSGDIHTLTEDEIQSLYTVVSNLPYLDNVARESLRLIPPLHSSIRVAMQDDEIPTMHPVHARDGKILEGRRSVSVSKGSFIHVAVEGFNLDKGIWGGDAWEFNPDRWDNLPESALQQPGLFANTLTFSAGPRSCIGMRFSIIEMKTFLFILLTNFKFTVTDDRIFKANVVLTRPYISGKFKEGSQCPLLVSRHDAPE